MTRRVERREVARRDLEEIAEHIRRDSPRAALRFVDAAEATFQLIARMPHLGTLYEPDDPTLPVLRFLPIAKFRKYLIFYRPTPDGIEVVRVLHGARDIRGILAFDLGIEGDAPSEVPEEP